MRETVVVTGAAGGIGAACVAALAPTYELVASDLDPRVTELSGVIPVVADLGTAEGRAAVVAAVGDRPLRGLVHLAGITRDALLPKLSDEHVRLVLRVNAVAPIRLSLDLADRISDGGAIVLVSSRAHLGNIGQVNYAASKGAVVGATYALAKRLAPRVRVNAVAPGLIATPMTAAMPPPVLEKLIGRVPLGRAGDPADVAAQIAFLLSGGAGYVTGQTVYVCGGRSR